MNQCFRFLSIVLLLVLGIAVTASTAFATTFSSDIAGDLDSSDPFMSVVFISPPNCAGQGSVQVRYEAVPFYVDTDGQYAFTLGSTDNHAVFYLYTDSFDPTFGIQNCTAADNTYPFEIVQNLTTAHLYWLVMIDDHQSAYDIHYNAHIEGAGNVIVGGVEVDPELPIPLPAALVGNCPHRLPTGSIVRNVPLGAPAYFAADTSSQTNFNLPAGNWYVSETSGNFSKVWIACEANPVWIPTNAIG